MRRFLTLLVLTATCLLGFQGAWAHPIVVDTTKKKGVAGNKVVDTAAVRQIPPVQVAAVVAWKDRLQNYYTAFNKSQNVYLKFCADLLLRSGLPSELKLLSLIESHMNPEALSDAGALGIWQLMPAVALENGLAIFPFDERKDIYKSTQVAVRVIGGLLRKFGDPLLVVAAYNCGATRVKNTLDEAGAKGYWAIHNRLPEETQNHVLKYLAAVSIFYNIPLPVIAKGAAVPDIMPVPPPKDTVLTTPITAAYWPEAIQKYTGVSPEVFTKLNPLMQSTLATQGAYGLRLPSEAMRLFNQNKAKILKYPLPKKENEWE